MQIWQTSVCLLSMSPATANWHVVMLSGRGSYYETLSRRRFESVFPQIPPFITRPQFDPRTHLTVVPSGSTSSGFVLWSWSAAAAWHDQPRHRQATQSRWLGRGDRSSPDPCPDRRVIGRWLCRRRAPYWGVCYFCLCLEWRGWDEAVKWWELNGLWWLSSR